MRIVDHGNVIHIQWEFDRWHKRNLEAVKSIPQEFRRYMPEKKCWVVDCSQRDVVLQWQYTHKAQLVLPENLKPEMTGDVEPLPELELDLPLKGEQRPYQKQGTAAMIKWKQTMNGDEQGLGKTFQSIAAILGANAFPCIVVCPSSTKYNWQREWHMWTNRKAMVLDATTMKAQEKKSWHQYVLAGMADVVIVNYESLPTFCVESFPQEKSKNGKKKPWSAKDVVLKPFMKQFKGGVLDESHRCKDPGTNQSKFILRLFVGLEYRYLLSGTPVINKPKDLWPQLAIMGKLQLFGGKKGFLDRYCEGGSGANNLRELNFLLRKHGCFFRREKKDVAKELPEKQRQTIVCDITTRAEYNKAERDLKAWLSEVGFDGAAIDKKMAGEALLRLNVMRQISARGKIKEAVEFTQEVIDAGEKLILFCNLYEIVDSLRKEFPGAVTVTGRDSAVEKQANIDRFQKDPSCQLIICNIKAAGVGITLTASSRVAFVEYPLTYADCVQCEDRSHRIGQVNNVMCTYFNGMDTIDERLYEIIQEKRHIGNTITGASDQMEMAVVNKVLNLLNF
jgi:SWI/SNF-related matrix-associated actin-dependent regulator of chromatin subfamily A-like protein 1